MTMPLTSLHEARLPAACFAERITYALPPTIGDVCAEHRGEYLTLSEQHLRKLKQLTVCTLASEQVRVPKARRACV